MLTREDRITEAFVELADSLVDEFEVVDFLQRLIEHSLGLLDADAAGIMLADAQGVLQVVASSSHSVEQLELFELQADSGPCIDCYRTGEPITPPDVATMRSWWPTFTPVVEALGYSSAQAIPMRLRSQVIGALNIFRAEEGALDDRDRKLGRALADVATVALVSDQTSAAQRVLSDQLQAALTSRVLLEQAKGMLAQRTGTSVDAAFEVMRTHARRTGRGLRDVAADVIAARGEAPL